MNESGYRQSARLSATELAGLAASGGADAEAKVIASIQPLLKSIILRWAGFDAKKRRAFDDALSVANLGALHALRGYDARRGGVANWLGDIAIYRVRGWWRDRGRSPAGLGGCLRHAQNGSAALHETADIDEPSADGACRKHEPEAPDGEAGLELVDHRDELRAALRPLRGRHYGTVLLLWAQGLTLRAIGAKLGISESRVCQIQSLALAAARARCRA